MLALCSAIPVQPQENRDAQNRADSELARAFSEKSAPELVNSYFDLPSIPLLVIRRLMNFGDPRVIPALRNAFDRERQPLTREFLAAALVRLGDKDSRYFDYAAGEALDAVNNGVPYWTSPATEAADGSDLERHEEIRSWSQAHRTPIVQAIRIAIIENPGAVEALALAEDRRSVPILLQALQSPNLLVVREAAFGLARMHETAAARPIIAVCQHLDWEERPWTAKSLLYIRSKKAQQAASALIADPARVQRWRADVNQEETMRAAVANLSKAVQLLDQAAVDVNRLDQAIKESNSAEAKGVLKEYIPRLGQLTKCLAQLPRGQVDDGLVSAVVNRLGAQRSELEGIRQTLPASGIRAVNRAASQLEAMSRMMWDIGPLEKL
jgi:HEAT repeat protein